MRDDDELAERGVREINQLTRLMRLLNFKILGNRAVTPLRPLVSLESDAVGALEEHRDRHRIGPHQLRGSWHWVGLDIVLQAMNALPSAGCGRVGVSALEAGRAPAGWASRVPSNRAGAAAAVAG